MPGNSIIGLSIKAIFHTLATLILTIVVIKPKELFSFLGLSGNILKGLGIALLCVFPIPDEAGTMYCLQIFSIRH